MITRPQAGSAPAALEDAAVRIGTVTARWLLIAAYALAARAGVVEAPLAVTGAVSTVLIVYQGVFTWYRIFRPAHGLFIRPATRLLDPVMVSLVLISMGDAVSPVWAVYFIAIVNVAQSVSRPQIVKYGGWVAANYAAATCTIAATGGDVSWPQASMVCGLIVLMAFNVVVVAGGEQRMRDVIAQAASTDSLTGLPNRHCFQANYPRFIERATEARSTLALMMVDVDHFKQINDRDGHSAGDDRLREVAHVLQSVVRGDDMVARYGGDEFVVIAPGAARDNALRLAERLRAAATERDASLSIGVALFPDDGRTAHALIDAADAALYRAKQDGRNCVRSLAA